MPSVIPIIYPTPIVSKTLSQSDWNKAINSLGLSIREKGHLIVFPTETVYGLGANALDKESVLRIFEAKERPLSDPVICHVACLEDALPLYKCEHNLQLVVIKLLAKEFWPGPLSIVGPKSDSIIEEITGGTGFVSVRCPNNQIALDLIKAAKVPIAAPSANKFGHISPSCPTHVVKDFQNLILHEENCQSELPILDGGNCNVGIESTVCKVDVFNDKSGSLKLEIVILRRGFISVDDISIALCRNIEALKDELQINELEALMTCHSKISQKICYVQNRLNSDNSNHAGETEKNIIKMPLNKTNTENHKDLNDIQLCSPGMLLTHYSPSVPTYLLQSSTPDKEINLMTSIQINAISTEESDQFIPLEECVIIDAFQKYTFLKNKTSGYFQLSDSSDVVKSTVHEMQQRLFHQLHQAEDWAIMNKAKAICICDFYSAAMILGEPGFAVYDRIFRSASGRVAFLS